MFFNRHKFLLAGAWLLIAPTLTFAQHAGDIWIGTTSTDQLNVGGFMLTGNPPIKLLNPSSGLFPGWTDNNPGFDLVINPDPPHNLYPLDPGAEIFLEVVQFDPAFLLWTPQFQQLKNPGDIQYLGSGDDLHEHWIWHIKSNDPGFDPLRTGWRATMKLTENGLGYGYTDSSPFTILYRNVTCTTGDLNGDDVLNDEDHELFELLVVDPGAYTAEQRCAADCNFDGLATEDDHVICEPLWGDHQHEGDIIVGHSSASQVTIEAELDEIRALDPVSGLLEGWTGDEPGWENLDADEPLEDFYTLAPEAQIIVELVGKDGGIKLWTPLFSDVLNVIGDTWLLGAPDFHEHAIFHIDSTDPAYDPLRTLWRINFVLHDLGSSGYAASEPFTLLFRPVDITCTMGDVNNDTTVDGSDLDPFLITLAGPESSDSTARCAADANLDGLVTPLDVHPFFALLGLPVNLLNLDQFPNYVAEGGTLPVQQQNAGPAVAGMVLDWIWWDSDNDPAPVALPQHSQSTLYAGLPSRNGNPALPYFDAVGMKNTIQQLRPLPVTQYGYNFSVNSNVDSATMIKIIAQWINYPVGSIYGGHEPGSPVNVPAAVPAYGNYTNWMAVRGLLTNVPAYPLPTDLTVYGFWVNDPVPGGLGENSFKTIGQFLSTYYLPLNQPGDPYNGKYLAVVEPPADDTDVNLTLVDSPARFDDQELAILAAADFTAEAVPVSNGRSTMSDDDSADKIIVQAAIDGVNEQLLPYDEQFAAIFTGTVAGKPLRVTSESGNDYFVIPFNRPLSTSTMVKPATSKLTSRNEPASNKADTLLSSAVQFPTVLQRKAVNRQTVVIVLIDAADGHFLEASWTAQPQAYLPIQSDKALKLAKQAAEEAGLEFSDLPVVKLVHRQGSPYWPEWKINIGSAVIYVDQQGISVIE
ncbi:MAG: hypothetical protein HJJLKODD_01386 [Phycisphaerae bacterium]|nr:hypothetical protein [Phycisphaerae bacterium]